jgi:hypothetical protein
MWAAEHTTYILSRIVYRSYRDTTNRLGIWMYNPLRILWVLWRICRASRLCFIGLPLILKFCIYFYVMISITSSVLFMTLRWHSLNGFL